MLLLRNCNCRIPSFYFFVDRFQSDIFFLSSLLLPTCTSNPVDMLDTLINTAQ